MQCIHPQQQQQPGRSVINKGGEEDVGVDYSNERRAKEKPESSQPVVRSLSRLLGSAGVNCVFCQFAPAWHDASAINLSVHLRERRRLCPSPGKLALKLIDCALSIGRNTSNMYRTGCPCGTGGRQQMARALWRREICFLDAASWGRLVGGWPRATGWSGCGSGTD